jgi:hypothetical protein
MKIYVQTRTITANNEVEARSPGLVLETSADAATVRQALEGLLAGLGRITAVPAAAHEANLRAVLPRDVVALPAGIGDGSATLVVERRADPDKADIFNLDYKVE